ncbi:putative amino acid permease protein [Phaeoacremonium minimum UCRPA7]|uniref:Putative amino acid permease protein n=1 Tax=Phaeoacremonium minimum (strain UCR-PA7) TaxID=1286976 RepID=R8BG71_PHAM7|nr:putative amino acid permease protein [Phaeoacremonium minimum UCRPA7]EON98292.1 putative amino acid permease protein [Phaeoacremonium minimum UCRPA7]
MRAPQRRTNTIITMSDHDAEKAIPSNGNGAATDSSVAYASEGQRGPWSRRFVDSFKRDPNAHVTKSSERAVTKGFDHEGAAQATANSGLSRKLQGRHLQMIAIGGSIGTGLFVTSGAALSSGGPASLIIAFGIIGIMIFCTVQALGEMAVVFPVSGSFSAFSTRFLDPAWGFAMGWNYAMQWLVVLPLEIVAASITLSFWPGAADTNSAAWVTIFLVVIVAINFFGVRGYGEAEYVFAIIKIIAVIGFIILGIVLNCGGGPNGEYIGNRYWKTNNVPADYAGYFQDPEGNPPGSIKSGAFNNGFKGLCSVFVTAAFSFAGTELVGLAAAEASNPRKTLPTAIKQVFWRICLFYMVALTVVSLLVPYGDDRLLGSSSEDAKASPFVIAINNAGISVLPSIMNVVILIAVLSVGNSSIYGSSRTLAALAEQGQAPRILGYIDRKGRPLVAIIVSSVLGLLCYVVAGGQKDASTALNWLYSLSGLSSIFTWGSICLAHIRFRKAWKAQGHSLDELAFTSQAGIIGSWIGFILNALVLIAQFWTAVWPVDYSTYSPRGIAENFFLSYLAAPVVILCYIPYKIYYKTPFMRSHSIDLVTGRRELDTAEIIAAEKAEQANWPKWKRVWKWLF